MKFKLFIFLALLFANFLFFSAAVAENSKDETKSDATEETNQGDNACQYRCCSHRGCRCCSYAEAQLMAAQAKDQKHVTEKELNQQNEVNYQGNCYGGGHGGGCGGGGGGGGGGRHGGGCGGGGGRHGGGCGGGGHGGGRGGGGRHGSEANP